VEGVGVKGVAGRRAEGFGTLVRAEEDWRREGDVERVLDSSPTI
jgi:hypothetical protein